MPLEKIGITADDEVGVMGTGQTHFMCDLARMALAGRSSALLALASSLDAGLDPLDGLADATGLAIDGEELLQLLGALGGRASFLDSRCGRRDRNGDRGWRNGRPEEETDDRS